MTDVQPEEGVSLTITEVPAEDLSMKYYCEVCDFNPFRKWCPWAKARFQKSWETHINSQRHKIATGQIEEPEKKGFHYITQLEEVLAKYKAVLEETTQKLVMTLPNQIDVQPVKMFEFKEAERKAICEYDNGSIITLTNIMNAICRCLTWCNLNMSGEKKKKNVLYLSTTRDLVRNIADTLSQGWEVEDEAYDDLEERLEHILKHQFSV